jgi:hypothetical protein
MKQYFFHQRFRKLSLSLLITSTVTSSFSFMGLPSVQAAPWDTWRSWFNSAPPRPRRGVPRGDTICLIAPLPTTETAKVWSDRPTFVLQGSVAKLEVWAEGAETAFWTQSITEAEQLADTIAATDKPTYAVTMDKSLESGQNYQLRVYTPYSLRYNKIDLQVMSSQEQNAVNTSLEQINSTGEAAVQRADYFAEQNLWLDFWQTVISAPVSEAWRTVNSNTIATLCPLLEASGTLPSVGSAVAEDGSSYMEHRFTGQAGQTVEITLENVELNMRLILTSPQGTVIDQIENAASDQAYSEVMTLPEDGEYIARVEAMNPQRRGEYNLMIISKFDVN